jgi:hypothetical protein
MAVYGLTGPYMKTTDVEFNLNNDSSCLYKNSTWAFDLFFQSENKKNRQRDKRLRSGLTPLLNIHPFAGFFPMLCS